MRLTKINYSQFSGTRQEWTISGLVLGGSNLVVGKNASGKTRTLNVIHGLGRLLSGKQKPEFLSGNYDTIFEHAGTSHRYCLEYTDRKVFREEFWRGETRLLNRGPGGSGTIRHEKEMKDFEFQTPETELAAVARRDSIQHSYLDPLGEWGAGVRHYAFGATMGQNRAVLFVKGGPEPDPGDTEAVVSLFRKGSNDHPETFPEAIKQDMCAIGYPVELVGAKTPSRIIVQAPFPAPAMLFVKERELQCETEQPDMSQGMFRALAIIIHANFAFFASRPSCIVIDDIGEGLDFDRSCKLIDLLRAKANESKTQLIMSTNDRFVMNRVPLEEWSVLQREAGKILVRNYQNSRQLFDEFKFTGLNNFDFFASDFLNQQEEMVAHE